MPPDTIPGPAHEKVAPAVDEDPFKAIYVTAQESTCGAPAFTFGAVMF